jgi:hypothetical protein
VASVSDPANDEEGAGPPWADLVGVSISDNGENARFTITMAGVLPGRVPDGQTFGAGVDLFRTLTQVESDYQLFIDGGSDGWFAYLSSGKKYVRYPGTLGIGAEQIVFTVPWSSIGNRTSGRYSAFVDWSRARTGDNEFSEDHAPALGTASYAR